MSLEEFTMKRVRRQFTVGFKSNWNGGADKKLDFLSDPIIPSELHRT